MHWKMKIRFSMTHRQLGLGITRLMPLMPQSYTKEALMTRHHFWAGLGRISPARVNL
jgi:hypothetical protein